MPKRSKRAHAAAKKAAATRRHREAAEFRRRSKASKKGWKRRKAKERIKEEAKVQPRRKGRLAEWLVKWSYNPQNGRDRIVDFTVIAKSKADAELFVVKAVAAGHDSQGVDLDWMQRIPWDEIFTMTAKEALLDERERKEIKALGEGWVEVT